MKGCPRNKKYDCEAYLGNNKCGLILDEECHIDIDNMLNYLKREAIKNACLPKGYKARLAKHKIIISKE